jgi:hypothetical protein
MKNFLLVRHEDVSGVSGTGVVAEGTEFSDKTVALRWKSSRSSLVFWPGGIDDVNAVHGHDGKTRVVWV